MQTATMRTTPIEPFGIEIDLDLRAELAPDTQEGLRALYRRHKLLRFRGQTLSIEQQRRVMGYLGPLDQSTKIAYVDPADSVLGSSRLAFHSDMGFVRHPLEGISLHAVDVEDDQTYTAFVNAADAYNRLPTALAKRLHGLTTVRVASTSSTQHDEEPPFETPEGVHSIERELLMTHPETGEPILYVGRGSISRIVGFDEPESRALLGKVYAYLYDEDHLLKHYWRNGDLLIWDNLALQHARPSLQGVTRRKLQRATIASHSQSAQMPASYKTPYAVSKATA